MKSIESSKKKALNRRMMIDDDVRRKLPLQYHNWADVFSKKASDTLMYLQTVIAIIR